MSSTGVQHDLLDWVRAALGSWPTYDADQARLRADYLAHLDAHPDALWREGPPAHLTASAFVLDADRRNVLLTLHRKGGFWVQFGGHLEPGDSTLSGAALREAAEESGIDGLSVIGPADLHRHELPAAFGRCREHLDAAYLVQAPYAARAGRQQREPGRRLVAGRRAARRRRARPAGPAAPGPRQKSRPAVSIRGPDFVAGVEVTADHDSRRHRGKNHHAHDLRDAVRVARRLHGRAGHLDLSRTGTTRSRPSRRPR